MKLIAIASTLALVLLTLLPHATPQAAPPRAERPSEECVQSLVPLGLKVLSTCGQFITEKPRPARDAPVEEKAAYMIEATNYMCTESCVSNLKGIKEDLGKSCKEPADRGITFGFEQFGFGRSMFCRRDGGEFCVKQTLDKAKELGQLQNVAELIHPPNVKEFIDQLKEIRRKEGPSIPEKKKEAGDAVVAFVSQYIKSIDERLELPKELLCTPCVAKSGAQGFAWWKEILDPAITDFFGSSTNPLRASVDGLVNKGNTICGSGFFSTEEKFNPGE